MSEAMRAAASLYNDPMYYDKSEERIRLNRIRRQRIFRRQLIALCIAAAILIFGIVFFTTSVLSAAQSDPFETEYKYYKTVTVHAGDSVWSIANGNFSREHYEDFDAYLSEICSINSLKDISVVNAGEVLIIPYFSTEFK